MGPGPTPLTFCLFPRAGGGVLCALDRVILLCRVFLEAPLSSTHITSIDQRLSVAGQHLERVEVADLLEMLSAGAILVDIRPESFRLQEDLPPEAIGD